MLKLTRLFTDKKVNLSATAHKRWNSEKSDFISRNNKDKSYDFRPWKNINGLEEHCLVHNPSKGETPWFTNYCLLIILDLFSFGWI